MWWLFIVIIILIAAFAVPSFGKALLGFGKILSILLGILAIIGVAWYYYTRHEEELAKTRISPNEIELSDLRLIPEDYDRESFKLIGRLKNKSSKYSLSELQVKIELQDHIGEIIDPFDKSIEVWPVSGIGQREVIGEDTIDILSDVPPGQVRNVDEHVYFSNLAYAKGKYESNYSITEIKGK